MENMDKELTVAQMGADKLAKNTPNAKDVFKTCMGR